MVAQSREQLFLIDGYALIYRAFFAMISRPLRSSRGENTSAVWGVANSLHRLFDTHAPTHVVWVNDAGTSFRTDTFPEYKATREKLDEELQEDFNVRSNEERQALQKTVLTAVDEVGKENNFDLIIAQGVMYVSDRINVTDLVLKKLSSK